MAAGESLDTRRKRLKLRSWRRGMREMDLLLGPFAESVLPQMAGEMLDLYEALLAENDQDIWAWILGRAAAPPAYAPLLAAIKAKAPGEGARP